MKKQDSVDLLRNQAGDAIRQMILDGLLLPGQPIVERDLAEKLGMSRAPVREGLIELEQEFIVRRVGSRTRVVAEMSLTDFIEMYEVREMLEGMAARLLSTLINPADCAYLSDLASRLDATPDGRDEDEFAFHEFIVTHSGNSRLNRLASTAHSRLLSMQTKGLIIRSRLMPPNIQFRSTITHQDIVDALASRDPDIAERVARLHIGEGRNILLSSLCMLKVSD